VHGAPPDLIHRVPIFADLERNELEHIAASFKESTFEPGDAVATEGQGGVGFFVIAEGEATVSVGGAERARLHSGDYFGEIALIDQGARTATVTAATPLRLYGLTSWEFRPIVESHSSIAWKLLQALVRRLRDQPT
jgi:CRP/FNR family transcriptional regulator, cyclic AMP receptor protein